MSNAAINGLSTFRLGNPVRSSTGLCIGELCRKYREWFFERRAILSRPKLQGAFSATKHREGFPSEKGAFSATKHREGFLRATNHLSRSCPQPVMEDAG